MSSELQALDDLANTKQKPALLPNCHNLVSNIRRMLRDGNGEASSQVVLAEVISTSRCDEHFQQMRVVRSRLLEHLGDDLYKKCIRPLQHNEAPTPSEEVALNDALAHYGYFIAESAKSCLPWQRWLKASLEDNAGWLILFSVSWLPFYKRSHGVSAILKRKPPTQATQQLSVSEISAKLPPE
eukprot:m.349506 g.349506  ORF g.349506 m.349506 type:complete len:183 (-) comp16151_c1_seq4:72-620(-)